MIEMHSYGWAILAVAAFLIGFSKTGFPGTGILAIPLAAMVIPAKLSTGLILPILIVGDIFAVAFYRRHAVWRHLVRLLPFAVVGVVLGYLAMGCVDDRQLGRIMGAIILVMLALNVLREWKGGSDLKIPAGWWFPALMGLLAGVTTMMANAAGPIMIIYLLAMRLPKNEFIGTGAWYFLIVNCFKVPFSFNLGLITPDSLLLNAQMVPFLIIGALAGVCLVRFVPEKAFTIIVQVLAAAAAVKLMF
ncbi:MAG: sulfite exporter TauE/SafE family protein [Planctomycetes bacterium]|nr:sulfite exporter TauE/SafE family protein [Planctomycetota bacterium]